MLLQPHPLPPTREHLVLLSKQTSLPCLRSERQSWRLALGHTFGGCRTSLNAYASDGWVFPALPVLDVSCGEEERLPPQTCCLGESSRSLYRRRYQAGRSRMLRRDLG